LNPTGYEHTGVAFFNAPIQGAFTANFRYKAGGGYHGDGFTMFFYKQKYTTIGKGGSLGFTPNFKIVPGYGIEFDAWQNPAGDARGTVGVQINPPSGDPSANHIALIDGIVNNHLAYVDDERVADNGIRFLSKSKHLLLPFLLTKNWSSNGMGHSTEPMMGLDSAAPLEAEEQTLT
jgi:hypothetical protein